MCEKRLSEHEKKLVKEGLDKWLATYNVNNVNESLFVPVAEYNVTKQMKSLGVEVNSTSKDTFYPSEVSRVVTVLKSKQTEANKPKY